MQVLALLAPLAAMLATSTQASATNYSPVLQNNAAYTNAVQEETKSLDQLYQDAIKEGGNLVVYHGGDTSDQQDWVVNAFRAAYPKINLTMVVDYSKYHNVRIDNQLATNSLVADVVALQTLQDYPRWKSQDKLLKYKPAGFSKIYPGFVDPDGAWAAHVVFTFSYFYDEAQLNASGLPIPKNAQDLGNPVYKDLISSSYPHDDDAALFVYSQYIDKYGWDWVDKLSKQNLLFQRGSDSAGQFVAAKKTAIGFAGRAPSGDSIRVITGKDASSPYLSWGQRIAILKKAPHPAAAKFFVNWALSKQTQSTVYQGISTRTDVDATPGSPRAWEVSQAGSLKFQSWMEDRANLERLKATLALYFGEVQGKPSPGVLGLHPGK